jgi:hypothetical protein
MLRPGINPLDRRMQPGMRTMEYIPERDKSELRTLPAYGPGPGEMERYRTPTAPGMTNMGGFDPSDLMAAPKLRQDATMNQANMVSSPYFEANEKAAEKTNPMNAASQEPGRSFLMKYIGK